MVVHIKSVDVQPLVNKIIDEFLFVRVETVFWKEEPNWCIVHKGYEVTVYSVGSGTAVGRSGSTVWLDSKAKKAVIIGSFAQENRRIVGHFEAISELDRRFSFCDVKK